MDDAALARLHEETFVASFLLSQRRERYLSLLQNAKKRPQAVDRLNHKLVEDLDPRFVRSTRSLSLLADDARCYVIACEDALDGTFVPCSQIEGLLRSALFGLVISILPGNLHPSWQARHLQSRSSGRTCLVRTCWPLKPALFTSAELFAPAPTVTLPVSPPLLANSSSLP